MEGFFNLPLPINDLQGGVNQDTIRRKLIELEGDLTVRAGREELAILNMKGLLQLRLEEYDDALDTFKSVLGKDEHNLNALANMEHTFKELDMERDAEEFRHRLEEDKHNQLAKARCRAEQAYAYASDLHTDRGVPAGDRLIESNKIFQETMDAADRLMTPSECNVWKFCMAKNAHKIFNTFSNKYQPKEATDYMQTALKLFHELTQSETGDSEYCWESWRNIADILRKVTKRNHLKSEDVPNQIDRRFVNNPEECMKEAVKKSPDNPRLLARYGNFVFSLKHERIEEALKHLDNSIKLGGSSHNYYAFHARGEILVKNLTHLMKKADDDSSFRLDRDMLKSKLQKAKGDLDKAITFRNAEFDLLTMAELHILMARSYNLLHEGEDRTKSRQYVEKAFAYLKRATKDDKNEAQRKVRQARGRCYFDIGEYRKSVNCYKEALAIESDSPFTGYFYEMFCSYLCLVREESEHKTNKNAALFGEMEKSLRQAILKHGEVNLSGYCCGSWQEEYRREMMSFAEYCTTIPDNQNILKVLTSKKPRSSLSSPPRKGGKLKEIYFGPFNAKPSRNSDEDTSIVRAQEEVKPSPTGSAGPPRIDCSAVVRRHGSEELAPISPASAALAATADLNPGIVNTTNIHININAKDSPLNFGTTHGGVYNYGTASITDGGREDVSPEAIQTLTELQRYLGKEQLAEVLSKGLDRAKKQGTLDNEPAQMKRLSEGSQCAAGASAEDTSTSTSDATTLSTDVAAASSGINHVHITEPFSDNPEQK